VIFVGPAEANLASRLGLQTLGTPQAFAFRYPDASLPIERPARAPQASQPKALRQPPAPPARSVDGRPRTVARHKAHPAAASLAPPPAAENDTAQLQAIASLANQGHIAQAQQACERLLAEQGPSAEVFYWLGLLSDASGQPTQAQGFYRKALYLQPQHPEALSHLAALLAAQGDLAAAGRLRVRAAQGVGKNV
jgi:chemotaxis protein methyltransferase WspC